ncbi:MAG: PhzF family phenazine biosynthesis protein [Candidatus Eremiobacteraeota bacterium]|nr:PhzF family phenazine biosynthesis protein [Candidatus Eremiobacteraeota bacterium]
MRTPIYQVDAFTTRRFAGNPAAVMPLEAFPADDVLQAIAAENNLAETAFLVRNGEGWRLRWFTPGTEVPLCGHATLASAWVVTQRLEPGSTNVAFETRSGTLTVRRDGERFVMNFPARTFAPIDVPQGLEAALGSRPLETFHDSLNFVALLKDAATVRGLTPDMGALERLDAFGILITAAGDEGYDCVSRYFAPRKGIPEDPVTGSAHCGLAPFWSGRLGKSEIRAYQASPRGGEVLCRVVGDRVELEGSCAFYLEGEVEI